MINFPLSLSHVIYGLVNMESTSPTQKSTSPDLWASDISGLIAWSISCDLYLRVWEVEASYRHTVAHLQLRVILYEK